MPEGHEELGEVVDDLHGAEDGEAGEESHGAPDQSQLGVDCHLHVPLYFIIGRRDKVDLDHLQGGVYGGVWGAWWLRLSEYVHLLNPLVEGSNLIFFKKSFL